LQGEGGPAFLHKLLERDIDFDTLRRPSEDQPGERADHIIRGASSPVKFAEHLLSTRQLTYRPGAKSAEAIMIGARYDKENGRPRHFGGEWPEEIDPEDPVTLDKAELFNAYKVHCQEHDFGRPVGFASFMLDRAYGKPRQEQHVSGAIEHRLSLQEQHLTAIRDLSRTVDGQALVEGENHPPMIDVTPESKDAAKELYAEKRRALG